MIKRTLDIIISGGALIILSPLLIVVGILVKVESSGPCIFIQQRVGRYGVPFNIYKFRSMVNDKMKNGLQVTSSNDARITPLGRVIRKYKLDELPQLFNVLLGDMSLVGPRPEVKKYVDYYPVNVREMVFSVRPGITDNASIHFIDEELILSKSADPNETYINEILPIKLKYYVDYVNEPSMLRDAYIVYKTVVRIINMNHG